MEILDTYVHVSKQSYVFIIVKVFLLGFSSTLNKPLIWKQTLKSDFLRTVKQWPTWGTTGQKGCLGPANYITLFSQWNSKSAFGPTASHIPHILFCVFSPLSAFRIQCTKLATFLWVGVGSWKELTSVPVCRIYNFSGCGIFVKLTTVLPPNNALAACHC